MPTSSNMIGHIYITELVFKQKLYVWYSCCYELRVITHILCVSDPMFSIYALNVIYLCRYNEHSGS